MKKDKRSQKASKTRQIKRTHKRKGRFWMPFKPIEPF
jgi:hypothetical protein